MRSDEVYFGRRQITDSTSSILQHNSLASRISTSVYADDANGVDGDEMTLRSPCSALASHNGAKLEILTALGSDAASHSPCLRIVM